MQRIPAAWALARRFRLSKHIPMQAGLAGGSADAAAVIRGLDQLWHLSLSLDEMIQIAVKIGADVPYCLVNTPAVVTGIGEQIAPIASFPSFGVLGVKPPISCGDARGLRGDGPRPAARAL
ncbi:MAG: 4-(cytidine 5'-diphospho)-2-C-methyl-D-erythritol kinase [Pseudoramibacter sp.]